MAILNATAFVPELWNAEVIRTKEDNLVLGMVSTKPDKMEGNVAYWGTLDDPTVSTTYVPGTVNWEFVKNGQIELKIDKPAIYAIKATSFEAAMANIGDPKKSQAARAAYKLNRAVETDVFQHIIDDASGGTVTDTTCDAATILGDIAQAATLLEEQNVMNKLLVVSPAIKNALINAGVKFQINNGINGKGGIYWCEEHDFKMFVTNTVYKNGGVHYCFACSENAIAYMDVLGGVETVNQIGDDPHIKGISGLLYYNYKVVRPLEVVKLALTPVTEANL